VGKPLCLGASGYDQPVTQTHVEEQWNPGVKSLLKLCEVAEMYIISLCVALSLHVYVMLFSNLLHYFFIKSTAFLYMFRALLCSSSGDLIVSIQHLVPDFVTVRT